MTIPLNFERVIYKKLNARQQEAFNFQKVSAVLADYGFVTIRLTSDWRGADFLAHHFDGTTFLKVQLKGRCCFYKKYEGYDLHVCFPSGDQWYLYPHDELLRIVLSETNIGNTASWKDEGGYNFATLPTKLRGLLEPYRLMATKARGVPTT
jgi:hypothetical protein